MGIISPRQSLDGQYHISLIDNYKYGTHTLPLCLLVFAIAHVCMGKVPLAVTSMIVCVALVITGVLNNIKRRPCWLYRH